MTQSEKCPVCTNCSRSNDNSRWCCRIPRVQTLLRSLHGLPRRLREDLIAVLVVCSPWGGVGVKTSSADLATPRLRKSVLWAWFCAAFIWSLKGRLAGDAAPGMLLELGLFPRNHTGLLAWCWRLLCLPLVSFQRESLQGCFWTNVILKHAKTQADRLKGTEARCFCPIHFHYKSINGR